MDKRHQINDFLDNIERQYGISIILAIESGSRAWGFPSKDSDYDIRLIYHHPKDWYLSAFKKRNVIENIFEDDLDAAGWDITKCLQLFYKSNAPLYEWLNSPIVYRKNKQKLDMLNELSLKAFNPKMVFYHYISLAKKKLLSDEVRTNSKSFLYALRALLCAQWVLDEKSAPPVEFDQLVKRYIVDNRVKDKLILLLQAKITCLELDASAVDNDFLVFARDLFSQLEQENAPSKSLKIVDVYDELLLNILKD